MAGGLRIRINRASASSITDQISETIRTAIVDGRLEPGARLPSWRDLAAQLGVARGTVRAAYERLNDELLVVASGPAGTHVAAEPPRAGSDSASPVLPPRLIPSRFVDAPFRLGVPALDAFPVKLWARVVARASRGEAASPTSYPDPCGALELRTQIAAYLAIARGIRCVPEQIIVTRGYRDGLDLALRALRVEGQAAWTEEPGFFLTRSGLALAGMQLVPVPVDDQGLVVQHGIARAPDAAIAVVTAGQQAPLGVTLSSARRHALLRWAARSGAWIIEDDYLSELQLAGRAAPALAAMEPAPRVIYIGTFSKTMSPALGVGFVVAPPALAAGLFDVAQALAPASNAVNQLALAEFLRDGHYLRHLRKMKRLYAARRDALLAGLAGMPGAAGMAGLALLLRLPPGSDDVALSRKARSHGLAPDALSPWYVTDEHRTPGLLLGVTNLGPSVIARACERLRSLVVDEPGSAGRGSAPESERGVIDERPRRHRT